MTERFDDSGVTGFLADKEVLAIRDHFFVKDDVLYLVLVIRYRAAVLPALAAMAKSEQSRDESWREPLTEVDLPLFETLRTWRSERCKQEGIPPYVICNNRQLAEVAKTRPPTLAALGRIDGFGEAKLKKYGNDLLALVAGAAAPSRPEGDHVSRVQAFRPMVAVYGRPPCASGLSSPVVPVPAWAGQTVPSLRRLVAQAKAVGGFPVVLLWRHSCNSLALLIIRQ